jgi:hypothetical protein
MTRRTANARGSQAGEAIDVKRIEQEEEAASINTAGAGEAELRQNDPENHRSATSELREHQPSQALKDLQA